MEDIGFLLMDLTKRLKTALNHALGPDALTISQWTVVAAIHRQTAPVTSAAVAASVGMDKPTVSGIVQRLADKQLVVLTPVPADHRARQLTLTPAGQHAYAACAGVAEDTVAAFLAPLDAAAQQQLADLLTTLERAHAHD
ncbi:MarR family winged helix-turn-helix transcriptional regulator [Lacticaseibacillus baoqingensis]|uniref:MarR family winged helix-turn-helix transcriptional regulator n=1 Tax=Lacticaseibacillus baoqingensis TaxID=2486013 RepID=A0ABW4E738_9LACO|nr:MarR family winged helix-turn-helix transcriptional regulator [Lacticaseibacillus baoqingensis]